MASTLQSMATRACIRSLPGITDVSDIPYSLLRPILKKIANPDHLHEIEINSPHIADADAELWKAFIARDIPDWQSKIVEPKNPRSWWKVYRKLVREEKREEERQREELEKAFSGISKQREAKQTTFVSKVIPQKPGRPAFVDGLPNSGTNSWGQAKTPALQNAKKGRDVINAIRAQSKLAAKEMGLGRPDRFKEAMAPNGRSQITKAPAYMVRDHQKPVPMATLVARTGSPNGGKTAPKVFAPSRKPASAQDRVLDQAIRAKAAEREDRLRALTNPKARPTATASPPAATVTTPRATVAEQSPPKAPGPRQISVAPSPPNTAPSRQIVASEMREGSPAAPVVRKRPASTASPFMPAKRRKV